MVGNQLADVDMECVKRISVRKDKYKVRESPDNHEREMIILRQTCNVCKSDQGKERELFDEMIKLLKQSTEIADEEWTETLESARVLYSVRLFTARTVTVLKSQRLGKIVAKRGLEIGKVREPASLVASAVIGRDIIEENEEHERRVHPGLVPTIEAFLKENNVSVQETPFGEYAKTLTV